MDTDNKGNSMQKMTDPVIDALATKNNGAVDNGPDVPMTHESRKQVHTTPFGPIVVKRAAIHGWSCDACHTLGAGWADIRKHFGRTEHRNYSEMR